MYPGRFILLLPLSIFLTDEREHQDPLFLKVWTGSDLNTRHVPPYSLTPVTSGVQKGNWMEAFKSCNSTKGVFSNHSISISEKYWGNRYILQTSFLSYKGCHRDIYGTQRVSQTLDEPDLVSCDKHCQTVNCTSEYWIGMKNRSCHCICVSPAATNLRSPKDCIINCSSLEEDVAKCGGKHHISIYKKYTSVDDNINDTRNCVNIHCEHRPLLSLEDCEVNLWSLCGLIQLYQQIPSVKSYENYNGSWKNTANTCYNSNGYLLDDKDKNYCQQHSHSGSRYWTSIHRYRKVLSIYNTRKLTYPPDLCEVLLNGTPSFESCQQSINYRCTSDSTESTAFRTTHKTTKKRITTFINTSNNSAATSTISLKLNKTGISRTIAHELTVTNVTQPSFVIEHSLVSEITKINMDSTTETSRTSYFTKIGSKLKMPTTMTKPISVTQIRSSYDIGKAHSVDDRTISIYRNMTLSTSEITSSVPKLNNSTKYIPRRQQHSQNLVVIIVGSLSSLIGMVMVVTCVVYWRKRNLRLSANKCIEEESLRMRHLERNCEDTVDILPGEHATPNKLTPRYQSAHRDTKNEEAKDTNSRTVNIMYATVDKRKSLSQKPEERIYINYSVTNVKNKSDVSDETEDNYYVASMDDMYDALRGKRERLGDRNNSDDLYSHTVSYNAEDGDCEYTYSSHLGDDSESCSEHYGRLSTSTGL